ncbi:MAG TPA: hypothetical protein VLH12_08790 [Usitatibacter sp.]|nr:hypothetical protein [Usitatibacter sp.]
MRALISTIIAALDYRLFAVTHPAAVRSVIADAVTNTIGASGHITMQTAAAATVATLPFSATAFGAAASGVSTANAITSDTNAVGGTIAKAEFQTSANVAKVLCSVTATGGGGDIQLSSVVVSAGQTVSLSSLTYTAPP